MNKFLIGIITILLILCGVLLVEVSNAQSDTWQFVAAQVVDVRASRSQDSLLLRQLQPGDVANVDGAYVFNDELIWIRDSATGGYIEAARYGQCQIVSFGQWNPPDRAPISLGQ